MIELSNTEKTVCENIKKYIEGGESPSLALDYFLKDDVHIDDMLAKSIIRYLFWTQNFPMGQDKDSKWALFLHKFFDARQGREKIEPDVYIKMTGKIIKDVFEIDVPEPEPSVQKKTTTVKKKTSTSSKTKPKIDDGIDNLDRRMEKRVAIQTGKS